MWMPGNAHLLISRLYLLSVLHNLLLILYCIGWYILVVSVDLYSHNQIQEDAPSLYFQQQGRESLLILFFSVIEDKKFSQNFQLLISEFPTFRILLRIVTVVLMCCINFMNLGQLQKGSEQSPTISLGGKINISNTCYSPIPIGIYSTSNKTQFNLPIGMCLDQSIIH